MGNVMVILDRDGNKIGGSSHSLACCAVASITGKKYLGRACPMLHAEEVADWIDQAMAAASPPDKMIISIFFCDSVRLTEEDIPALEMAIEEYPESMNDGPKRLLASYLKILGKYGEIVIRYTGDVFTAMTVISPAP